MTEEAADCIEESEIPDEGFKERARKAADKNEKK